MSGATDATAEPAAGPAGPDGASGPASAAAFAAADAVLALAARRAEAEAAVAAFEAALDESTAPEDCAVAGVFGIRLDGSDSGSGSDSDSGSGSGSDSSDEEYQEAAARLPGLWPLLTRQLHLPDSPWSASVPCWVCCQVLHNRVTVLRPRPLAGLLPGDRAGLTERERGGGAAAAATATATAVPTYSLLCTLDAGLLPAVEQTLRDSAAWGRPGRMGQEGHGTVQLLGLVDVVQRHSRVWPAVLVHGEPGQVVLLVATLAAVCRHLARRDVRVAVTTTTAAGAAAAAAVQARAPSGAPTAAAAGGTGNHGREKEGARGGDNASPAAV
ncbi:hypothetical protein HYH02_015104 [Chlamydomonas schloesseri]|uniref:phytol kinase n=1 Tax=Chlamydomonas schloesseri TaxID=2026947 RepID=A0A835VTL2_9CHLO|nr:hypothetical protein HYH02_015104 [Chlamydomonas schloesseri]|eukprot:KAG2424841.1 hypothetical protein HYH02_015104 [Chlamydomonas schloesseri]